MRINNYKNVLNKESKIIRKGYYKRLIHDSLFDYNILSKLKEMNKINENNSNNNILLNTIKINILIKNNKKLIISMKYWIIIYFIFMVLINPIITEKIINKNRKLQIGRTINLKVTGGLSIKIVNSKFNPNRIYINGVKSSISKGTVNIENAGINNVTLEYDQKKTNLDRFFQTIENVIEIDLSNFDTTGVTSMKYMFLSCINLRYINFNNVDTSYVSNMTSMFEDCRSLTSLNLSNFDVSNVIYMNSMFKGCNALTSLDLTSFRPKLRKIQEMFSGCKSLTNLIIPNIDTSLITTMEYLFLNCTSLTSIDITNFNNTYSLNNMTEMFKFCESLKSLDLSKMVISNVKDMSSLFYGCKNLISLNISNFITTKVENFELIFYGCTSLKYIDLSSFNTDISHNMKSMFKECTSLISIDLSNFNFLDKNLGHLFYNCESLKSIIFPKNKTIITNIEKMFYNCKSLVSLDLSSFDFKLIENMEYLFYNCLSLTSLDLSNIQALSVTSMDNMFSTCSSLKIINFTNFTILSVKTINSMFINCFSLISLDLSSFNTSSIIDMSSTFSNCTNLTFINISNFDTSLVFDMSSMFYRCNNLKSLNLSSFNTSNVINMEKMFYECNNLISLDLSNFNTKLIESLNSMFYECKNLKFINFYNYDIINTSNCQNMFYGTPNNLIICINEKTSKQVISELFFEQCIINDCSIVLDSNNKIIYENRICIDDCIFDEINKYKFKNFCYEQCPKGTHSNKENNLLCEYNIFECLEDHPFLIIQDNSCTEECNCRDFFNNICKLNSNNAQSQSILISSIIKGIQEDLINEPLEDLINNEKNDIIKIENNTIYQITTSFNQNNKEYLDISSIKLGECENILKQQYDILENETLIIFKTEQIIEGVLIPFIELEVFNSKTKEKLDLDYCRNKSISIDISIPISINENILFKYDPNNSYYNDICSQINTENETDISIYDRKNEFNNNFSLCQNNCIYNEYDYSNKKVICKCEIKDRILISDINKENLLFKIVNNKRITNFNILKCCKLVFSIKGLSKNVGNYLIILIIILYIVSAIYFYFKGYNIICNQINEILNDKYFENNKQLYNNIKGVFKDGLNDMLFSLKKGRISNLRKYKLDNFDIKNKIDSENSINKSIFNEQSLHNTLKRKSEKNKKYADYEINLTSYDEALKKDKRTYFQFYISLIKQKHLLFFSFNPNKDYNAYIIKVCLFFFSFALYLVINTLFFNDTIMHRIYIDRGNYNFKFILPQIIYSIIIISIICTILQKIFLTQQNILEIKYEKNQYCLKGKVLTTLKKLIIKFVSFFFFSLIFLIIFWYYLSCFCAVYKNTQLYIIKNSLIGFFISFISQFIFYLLPGIFRYFALKNPGECLYKISQRIQRI